MLFNNSICYFEVLPTRSNGLVPLSLQKTFVDIVTPLVNEERVDAIVFDHPASAGDALC